MFRWTLLLFLLGAGCGFPPAPPPQEAPRSSDRCSGYVQEVRVQHFKEFGENFPYWYGVGQLRQESACRSTITAFDGGMGIAQFMPATLTEVEKDLGVPIDPTNAEQAIRAQAYYMHKITGYAPKGPLWTTYQKYNGGAGNLQKEFKKAGVLDWEVMRQMCSRKVITLKNGSLLDMCDVNYDYSKKIAKYAETYRMYEDRMRFW
jgi:hypothetical protein